MRLAVKPVSDVGQPWTYYEIDAELSASGGASSTCLANQALHGQSESLQSLVGPQLVAPGTGPGRESSLFDRRSMSQWATHINVPVYMSGALQDEQTGPQGAALLDALPTSTPVYGNLVNGGHIDSADPQMMSRWLEFLDIYVAKKVPADPGPTGRPDPRQFRQLCLRYYRPGAPSPIPFHHRQGRVAARAEFASATPRVRVLFDNGAGSVGAGDPQSTYSAGFTAWPPTGTVRQYFLGPNGTLSLEAPKAPGSASLASIRPCAPRPAFRRAATPGLADPRWDWTTVPAADGAAFQTPPFKANTTFVGPATLDLWVKSATPVVDLQATITEVRPSAAQEEYVTSGFLRSSNQVDLPTSTELVTSPSYLGTQARDLSASSYRLVRIPIDPIANTFRAGTELRIVISAPGGDRPSWTFDTVDTGQAVTLGFGGIASAALVVDQVSGVHPTSALPSCGSLRGEPCRAYQKEGNQ